MLLYSTQTRIVLIYAGNMRSESYTASIVTHTHSASLAIAIQRQKKLNDDWTERKRLLNVPVIYRTEIDNTGNFRIRVFFNFPCSTSKI